MKAAKKYFQGFNEWIIKNTPQISAKIAEVMARIADVFGSVFKFFGKVGTALSQWWSGQPTWVKNMMAGVGILGAIFLGAQNPLLAIGMAIAGIFLLIDDYVRWTQNRESALGKIWEAITKACQKVKPVIEDWKNKAIKWFGEVKDWFVENGPAIQTFWSNFKIWVGEACDWVIDKTGKLLQSLKEFTGKLGFLTHQIEEKGFWPAVKGLFNGDFEADWQKFKQGDQAIESEWRNNLIQKRIIEISQRDSDRKNKEREQYIAEGGDITHFNDFYYNKLWKEASHELTEEGKLKPWTAGSKTDQLSTPKPANYNEQTDKYDDIINDAGNKYGVSQQVIKAIIAQESNFDPNVVSPKGAQGLMQLTPIAQKQVGGIKNPFDPRENIFKGVQYYKWCLEQVGGDRDLALIAYNAGPTYAKLIKEEREKKKNWSYDDIGYDETRQYVKNITSYLKNGKYAFSVDNANYLKASTSLINMKGLYQHDNSSCGLTSVAMANNYLNGNQNLDDIELRRRYGDNFSLQGVANDTVNSNYRWVDKGNIGYKGWDNDIDNALAKGYPVIVAGNGKGVSESGNGHIFVIYGKKNDKYLVKDPNEGKITDITKERLLSDEKHPDGNFVFIPEYIGKEKESRLRPQNPTPQQATSKKPKSIVNANKTTPPRGGRVNPRIATTSNKATQLIQTTRNSVITEKNIEEYKKQQDSIENNRRLVNGYKEASFWQMLVDWGHDEWGRGIDRVDGTSSSTTSYNITVNVIAEDDPYKTGEKIAVSLNNKMQFLNNSRNFGYA